MQKNKLYTIDLTRIKGNGTIKCPKCGIGISPDDTSEEAYTILEPVMEDDRLEKISLQCNNCGSKINLMGFNTITKKVHIQN